MENLEVIKRDGRVVQFNDDKIVMAIQKGFYQDEQSLDKAKQICATVLTKINELNTNKIEIERIQDFVEEAYIENSYINEFKRFKNYRQKRTLARECFSQKEHKLMKTLENFGIKEASEVDEKRENANINGDTAMGMMLKYGSTLSKAYTTSYCLDKAFSDAHDYGDIHIHDMDFYPMGTTTCLQIDLEQLFEGGFNTGHGFLREPKSIGSYASLAAIAIQSNQNDQHGGQAIPLFDYYLAKGVLCSFKKNYTQMLIDFQDFTSTYSEVELQELKDKIAALDDVKKVPNTDKIFEKVLAKTEKDTYQAMEGLVHNLNTMHSRAGAQVPFSSINFGTCTSESGRMVTRNLLLAMESGLGNHETPIFPILIFKVKEGINFNEGEINYDLFKLAIRCSSKRMFPNFAFIDATFNKQHYQEGKPETEIAYMGCRTRVIGNSACPNDEVVVGRGNLSFTSINLPRLGIKYGCDKKNLDGFYKELDQKLELIKNQLIERFEVQGQKKVKNFPFLMAQGNWKGSASLGLEDSLREVLKQGTLTIGFIGLAECLTALHGEHHGQSDEAQALGLEIVSHMREKCDQFSKETGLNFSLIATPAEGLSGRFVKMDLEMFGHIPHVNDKDYYTNSFHVPVGYQIDIKKKMQLEAPYHEYTNGGHISYVEVDGDLANNEEAFEKIVRIMREANIGYGAINHPLDRDPVCGYNGIIKDECPQCHRQEGSVPFERIRRITGYLVGTLDRFNNAKLAEVQDRVKHGKN